MAMSCRLLRRFYVPLLLLLIAGVAAFGCGSPENSSPPEPETSTQSLTQADAGQGGVGFQATVLTSQDMAERGHPPDHVGFLIQLDTHSGSLLEYDLAALATLRDGSGHAAQALGWEPLSGDSHHRSGLLYFPWGLPTVAAEARYMELSLRNVGGVPERVLRWELPLPLLQGSFGESSAGKKRPVLFL